MNSASLIAIEVSHNSEVQVTPIGTIEFPLIDGTIVASTQIVINQISYSVFVDDSSQSVMFCQSYNDQTNQYFTQPKQLEISYAANVVQAFYFGNQPWLMTYHSNSDYARFYQINPTDLSLTHITDTRLGMGYTTLQPLYYRNQVFFVAYNKSSGEVAKFQMMSPAYSALYCQKSWSDTWAQGWTRFAFFRLGAENFFIKTNEKYQKVNIDHFVDDINQGSHPVLNQTTPEQMNGLSEVHSFYNCQNDPFFLTYRKNNGELTFNRFKGDCLGWQLCGQCQQTENAQLLHLSNLTNRNLVLFC